MVVFQTFQHRFRHLRLNPAMSRRVQTSEAKIRAQSLRSSKPTALSAGGGVEVASSWPKVGSDAGGSAFGLPARLGTAGPQVELLEILQKIQQLLQPVMAKVGFDPVQDRRGLPGMGIDQRPICVGN